MSSADIDIRFYREGDSNAVADIITAVYGSDAVPPKVWQWRHFGWDPQRSATLVAEADGQIVGLRPMELYDFVFRGKQIVGGVFSGVMVHPDYRRRGVFTALVARSENVAWERGAWFVTTMPNHSSYRGFIKRGYVDPGCRLLLVCPLHPMALLARHLRAIEPIVKPMASMEASLVSGMARLLSRNGNTPSACRFGEEHDRLAEAHAVRYGGLVLLRKAHWLRWRFAESPWRKYKVLESRDCSGHLTGYAITTVESRNGLCVGYVVDLIALERRFCRALIRDSLLSFAGRGCDVAMAVISAPTLKRDFVASGFIPVPSKMSPKKFYTVVRLRREYKKCLSPLEDISNWYLTFGDWDTI
jgi:GNAT superfamily N-acetyltransferase